MKTQILSEINTSIKNVQAVYDNIKSFHEAGKTPSANTIEWNKLHRAFKKAQYKQGGLSWQQLDNLSGDEIIEIVKAQKEYENFVKSTVASIQEIIK